MQLEHRSARDAARITLAASVGPAIVWTGVDHAGRYIASTDTTPGLDLEITTAGGVATPLDAWAPGRMRAAMTDDTPRVLRTVREMTTAAARYA